MKLLTLLSFLTLAPYEEAPEPMVSPGLASACADLDAKLAERKKVLADAQVASARALVRYDDAVKAKLPAKANEAQVRRAADAVLAAHAELERAEWQLQLARDTLTSMQKYVTEQRVKLGCHTSTPRG